MGEKMRPPARSNPFDPDTLSSSLAVRPRDERHAAECPCDLCVVEREAAAVIGDELARACREEGEAAASAWLMRRLGERVPSGEQVEGETITPSLMREAIERRLQEYVAAGIILDPQVTVRRSEGGTFEVEVRDGGLAIVVRQVGDADDDAKE